MLDVEGWWDTVDWTSKLETRFKKDVLSQDSNERQRGRAAILEFSGSEEKDDPGGIEQEVVVSTPQDLRDYLDKPSVLRNSGFVGKLIILEDLGRDWVEILGSIFDIPIQVFALHWANPDDHILGDARVPLGQSPNLQFVLSYRQSLALEMIDSKREDTEYRLVCSAIRPITSRLRPYEGVQSIETCEQLVSYWAVPNNVNDNGPWTTILLVDPYPKDPHDSIYSFTRYTSSESAVDCRSEECPPLPALSQENDLDSMMHRRDVNRSTDQAAKQRLKDTSMTGSSMFDDLLQRNGYTYLSKRPVSATYWCQRLVLARVAAVVNSALVETIALTAKASRGVKNIADFNFENFEQRAWSDQWRGEFFTYLWEIREDLELMGYRLYQNLKVLKRLATSDDYGSVDKKHGKPKELRARQRVEDDLAEWENLQDLEVYMFKIMERTTESYLQTVQATGAQFANIQARSARRLTGLATLFVPASLCAAVLAIPSFSGAGDMEKFWIFWAVSVPLAIILAICLLSPFPKWCKETWKSWTSSPTPEAREQDIIENIARARVNTGEQMLRDKRGVRARFRRTPNQTRHEVITAV